MTEPTDEDVALRVLARLKEEAGPASLRDLEVPDLVSRGTLARWESGKYGMKPKTKRRLLEWLEGGAAAPPSASYADGIEDAIEEVETAFGAKIRELRERAAKARAASSGRDEDARRFFGKAPRPGQDGRDEGGAGPPPPDEDEDDVA